jgi:hypothetical protein
MRIPSASPLVVAALAFIASSADSMGAATVLNTVNSFEGGPFGALNDGDHNLTFVPAFPIDTFSYAGETVTVATSAAIGRLDNDVQVDIYETPSYSENGSTISRVRWDDNVTLSAAGLAGQPGTVTMQLVLNGSFTYITDPGQSFSFTLDFGANGFNYSAGPLLNATGQLPHNYNAELLTLAVPFTFGTPFALFATMTISDSLSAGQISPGQIAQFHGEAHLRWAGFGQVLDSINQPVSIYSVSSDSGLDYAQPVPVPEPAATAFAMGGAMLLLLAGRAVKSTRLR